MSTKRVTLKPSTVSASIADADKKKSTRGKKTKDVVDIDVDESELTQQTIAESNEMNEVMMSHQKDVVNAKKTLKHPVSDDTLDDLEAQVDKFNETKHLGEKISIHSKLKDSIQILEQEVDDMVEIIDRIDIDAVSAELKHSTDINDRTDITEDIVNLEKMVEGMKEEEIMQIKLLHIKKITDIVKKCKSKCDSSKMRIAKCN